MALAANTLFDTRIGDVSSLALKSIGLATGGLFVESYQDNIVAHAGGGQSSAYQLTSEINRITTVATSGDSVALPGSQPGLSIMVINHGVNPVQVYGAPGSSDTVDDVAAATGVSQMQGSVAFYICATSGAWYSEGIGTGYAGSFQTFSCVDALTATGSNQAGALAITRMMNRFTTVASSTGAVLPVAVAGMNITVINAGANALQVYGNGSDTINGTAGATGLSLASGKTAEYFSTIAGAWHQLLSA